MHLARRLSLSAAILAVAGGAAPPAHAQYQLRQRPDMTTSDDARRVPVPPHDSSNDPVLVVRGATLVDGTGRDPVPNAVLVVRGNHVLDVGPAARVKIPARVDRTIDAGGLSMMP